MLNVNKRDGTTEPFSFDKLINSIAKAGLSIPDAQKIAAIVQKWVDQNKVNDTIGSAELREQVIQSMKKDFPIESASYESYSKI